MRQPWLSSSNQGFVIIKLSSVTHTFLCQTRSLETQQAKQWGRVKDIRENKHQGNDWPKAPCSVRGINLGGAGHTSKSFW